MKALIHFIKHIFRCKTVPKCWIASLYLKIGASINDYELLAIKYTLQSELEDFKLCDRQRAELIHLIKFCDYRLELLKKYKKFRNSLTNNLPFLTSN